MKRKIFISWITICLVLGLSLVIGTLVCHSNTKRNYELVQAREDDVQDFLHQPLHDIKDDPVFASIFPYHHKVDINDADLIKKDQNHLFVLQNGTLLRIDNRTKTYHKRNFNDFYPYELQVVNQYLILFGGKTEDKIIELDDHHSFPYTRFDCEIMIVNKDNLEEVRHFIFYNCYYETSLLRGQKLYFAVGTNEIVNPETEALIYPRWKDSLLGNNQLLKENLYLSNSGNPTYSMTLIGTISLEDLSSPVYMKGIIGAEGFIKVCGNYFLLATNVYDTFSSTIIHVFELDQLKYLGYKQLKGYLVKESAMDVYRDELHIILSYFENETFHNVAYRILIKQVIKIKQIFLLEQKEIAPYESIYAVQFQQNYAYVSAYQDIDPLYLIHYSSNGIEVKIKKEMDFVNEYIELRHDEIRTIGRKIDAENRSLGLVFARFDSQSLNIKQSYFLDDEYADSEIRWNEKSLYYSKDYFFLPGYDQQGSCIYVFHDFPNISLIKRIRIENEYLQRAVTMNDILYIIGEKAIYLFSIDNFVLQGNISYA